MQLRSRGATCLWCLYVGSASAFSTVTSFTFVGSSESKVGPSRCQNPRYSGGIAGTNCNGGAHRSQGSQSVVLFSEVSVESTETSVSDEVVQGDVSSESIDKDSFPDVEALNDAESLKETHNLSRPARASLKKHRKSAGQSIAELKVGSVFNGIVRTVAKFGAFVDIGVGPDGLLHISNIADGRVANLREIIHQGEKVEVKVVSLDLEKNRYGLSLLEKKHVEGGTPTKDDGFEFHEALSSLQEEGWDPTQLVDGLVLNTVAFGCFVKLDSSLLNSACRGPLKGLVHISSMSEGRVDSADNTVKAGDIIPVRLKAIVDNRAILSMLSADMEEGKWTRRNVNNSPESSDAEEGQWTNVNNSPEPADMEEGKWTRRDVNNSPESSVLNSIQEKGWDRQAAVEGTVLRSVRSGHIISVDSSGLNCDCEGIVEGLIRKSARPGRTSEPVNVGDNVQVRLARIKDNEATFVVASKEAEPGTPEESKEQGTAVLSCMSEKGWDTESFVEGTVRSTASFGCFVVVDASLLNHECSGALEGLVHISALTQERVDAVTDVANVGDKVQVRLTEIQSGKAYFAMVAKGTKSPGKREPKYKGETGAKLHSMLQEKGWDKDAFVEGTVFSIPTFGCFVRVNATLLNDECTGFLDGLVHISSLSSSRIDDPTEIANIGDTVQVRVKHIGDGKVSLSMLSKEEDEKKNPVQDNGPKDWKQFTDVIEETALFLNGPVVDDRRIL